MSQEKRSEKASEEEFLLVNVPAAEGKKRPSGLWCHLEALKKGSGDLSAEISMNRFLLSRLGHTG